MSDFNPSEEQAERFAAYQNERSIDAADLAAFGITPAEADSPEPGTGDEFDTTDTGNAERVRTRHGGGLRYVPPLGRFLAWNGTRWKLDQAGIETQLILETGEALIRRAVKLSKSDDDGVKSKGMKLLKHCTSWRYNTAIRNTRDLLSKLPGMCVMPEELDADPWLLGCRNGVIDLRTDEAREPHPRDFITKRAEVDTDPAADAPLWRAFIDRIMGGNEELIGYLQKLAGLCLTGDATVQELFIFYGGGANGKSVFVDTLLGLLGDYAGSAPDSLLTVSRNEHPTELADLLGRRLVVASETEAGAKLRIQLVKKLTGDARIKGRYMRQDFFEFDRTHKLILVSNNKPVVGEGSHAVWRRLRLVPFAVTIPKEEQDPNLLEKLRAERAGILNWAVDGCQLWLAEGMNPPAAVRVATDQYRAESDPLGEYLEDRCVLDADARVPRNDLLGDYESWAKQAGEVHPLSRNEFYDRIRKLDGVSDERWRSVGVSDAIRGFTGIGLAYEERIRQAV